MRIGKAGDNTSEESTEKSLWSGAGEGLRRHSVQITHIFSPGQKPVLQNRVLQLSIMVCENGLLGVGVAG